MKGNENKLQPTYSTWPARLDVDGNGQVGVYTVHMLMLLLLLMMIHLNGLPPNPGLTKLSCASHLVMRSSNGFLYGENDMLCVMTI